MPIPTNTKDFVDRQIAYLNSKLNDALRLEQPKEVEMWHRKLTEWKSIKKHLLE